MNKQCMTKDKKSLTMCCCLIEQCSHCAATSITGSPITETSEKIKILFPWLIKELIFKLKNHPQTCS